MADVAPVDVTPAGFVSGGPGLRMVRWSWTVSSGTNSITDTLLAAPTYGARSACVYVAALGNVTATTLAFRHALDGATTPIASSMAASAGSVVNGSQVAMAWLYGPMPCYVAPFHSAVTSVLGVGSHVVYMDLAY